jgi:ATP-dependent helicase IRC3
MSANYPKAGFIYIIGEKSAPGRYKVGKTTQKPATRAKQQAGPFAQPVVEHFRPFHDHDRAEKAMHVLFAGCRQGQKEVFAVDLPTLINQLDELYKRDKEANSGEEAVVLFYEKSYTMTNVITLNEGVINVAEGDNRKANGIAVMPHQRKAQEKLSEALRQKNGEPFSGILSLPTGGGKTFTAVEWILDNWLAQGKRVLWIAHRTELLNQAFQTFVKHSYQNLLKGKAGINFLIVSGEHELIGRLKPQHELVIASVGSLHLNLDKLRSLWLDPNQGDDLMLVIDEAHHAAAQSYVKIIKELRAQVPQLKMLGLTATPYRTEEFKKPKRKKDQEEDDLTDARFESKKLGKIFTDNIVYSIALQQLIEQKILSQPSFVDKYTEVKVELELTEEEKRRLEQTDILTPGLTEFLSSFKRNNFIVTDYVQHQAEYGKTILFAINQEHALALYDLFTQQGIACEYVISGGPEGPQANKTKIDNFRKGVYSLFINVNILTEGTDLPDVQTVLLARPTSSSILMMQMIGRALRGEKAGGTAKANIINFADDFTQSIRFINPEALFISENTDFEADDSVSRASMKKLITLAKVQEFNRIARGLVPNDSPLFQVDFLARIPIGSYFLANDTSSHVMVFSHLAECYQQLVADLPNLEWTNRAEENDFPALVDQAVEQYFAGYEETIGFDDFYIEQLLRYYAFEGLLPKFIPFAERESFDIAGLAQEIITSNMSRSQTNTFLNQAWQNSPNHWQLFFGISNIAVFRNEVRDAEDRLLNPDDYTDRSAIVPKLQGAERVKRARKPTLPPPAPHVGAAEGANLVENAPAPYLAAERTAELAPIKLAEVAKEKPSSPKKRPSDEGPRLLTVSKKLKQEVVDVYVNSLTWGRNPFYAQKNEPIFQVTLKYANGLTENSPVASPVNGIVRTIPAKNEQYEIGEVYAEITPLGEKIADEQNVFLFGVYHETYFEATFNPPTKTITHNGQTYKTPTTAAKAAVLPAFGEKSLNGRDFWRYVDPKTKRESRLGAHPVYQQD